MSFTDLGRNNNVSFGKNLMVTGKINGSYNTLEIGDCAANSQVNIVINGNNNNIKIINPGFIKKATIFVGNHIPANNVKMIIERNVSIEPGANILLYNSGNILVVSANCMISKNLNIRCGESPHLIFDCITHEYLDKSEGIFIGEHVWIGEDVYITKNVTIPDETIVAARSVVTRRFHELNTAIGGNPAKVIRENVQWIRNHTLLERGSGFEKSFTENKNKYK